MISEKIEAAGGLLLGTAREGKEVHIPRILETYFRPFLGRVEGAKPIGGRGLLKGATLALEILIGMAKRPISLILRA